MITSQHTQEAISQAFAYALAGTAGLNVKCKSTFDYGIDGTFANVVRFKNEIIESGFCVDFQLKATTYWIIKDNHVIYDLSARTHRLLSLREPGATMAILILLCMPKEQSSWVFVSNEFMRLHNCCYWYQPIEPPTENEQSVRIRIPTKNLLTPTTLKEIMERARTVAMGTAL